LAIVTKRFLLFSPALAAWVLSLVLLTLPGSKLPHLEWIGKYQVDKAIHFTMFFGLVVLYYYPLHHRPNALRLYRLIAMTMFTYGILMEIVQKYWIPLRSFEWLDIVADGLGCLVAYAVLRRFVEKHAQTHAHSRANQGKTNHNIFDKI